MSRVFTPDDFVAYVTRVPELDAFARFLAASKSGPIFQCGRRSRSFAAATIWPCGG